MSLHFDSAFLSVVVHSQAGSSHMEARWIPITLGLILPTQEHQQKNKLPCPQILAKFSGLTLIGLFSTHASEGWSQPYLIHRAWKWWNNNFINRNLECCGQKKREGIDNIQVKSMGKYLRLHWLLPSWRDKKTLKNLSTSLYCFICAFSFIDSFSNFIECQSCRNAMLKIQRWTIKIMVLVFLDVPTLQGRLELVCKVLIWAIPGASTWTRPIFVLKRILIYSRPKVKWEIVKFFGGWGIGGRARREKTISNRGNRMCKSLETRELEVLYVWELKKLSVFWDWRLLCFSRGALGWW